MSTRPLSFKSKPKHVFCLYSQAEVVDLYSVLQERQEPILAFGRARKSLENSPLRPLLLPLVGEEKAIGLKGTYRENVHGDRIFRNLVARLPDCTAFVTGMGSKVQANLCKEVKKQKGSTLIGVYDPFEPLRTHGFALHFLQCIDALFVPSAHFVEEVASLKKTWPFVRKDLEVHVVGKASLDRLKEVEDMSASYCGHRPYAIYTQCYHTETMEDFKNFCLWLQSKAKFPQVFVALHPSLQNTGEQEALIIKGLNLQGRIELLHKKDIPETYPVSSIFSKASVVISTTSGTVIEAACMGVPSIYTRKGYNNWLVRKKHLRIAENLDGIEELLHSTQDRYGEESFFSRAGIPKNATGAILDLLEQGL